MQKKDSITGLTCGAFDITHAGHYLMFKECRGQCDFLIVGLQVNPNIDRKEKHKPVQTLKERKIQLEACKYIDKIITYKTEKELVALLKKLQPSIRFIGADWKGKNFTGKELPIKVIFNSRNHNYSSSALRARIIKAK